MAYDDAEDVFEFPLDKETMHITRQYDGGEQKNEEKDYVLNLFLL